MNTKSVHTQSDSDTNHHDSHKECIHLPEPDTDNITVLTHNLPNKPILPWNRYDSPWDEKPSETESEESEADINADLTEIATEENESQTHVLNADAEPNLDEF